MRKTRLPSGLSAPKVPHEPRVISRITNHRRYDPESIIRSLAVLDSRLCCGCSCLARGNLANAAKHRIDGRTGTGRATSDPCRPEVCGLLEYGRGTLCR